jgi:hypothetical protein
LFKTLWFGTFLDVSLPLNLGRRSPLGKLSSAFVEQQCIS